MKGEKQMWKIIASIWITTGIAICIALYYTHDIRCLWFLLIPALIRIHAEDPESESDEK